MSAQILARERSDNTGENLLFYLRDDLVRASDGRGHTFLSVGDESRGAREEVQDMPHTSKVILLRGHKNHQVIGRIVMHDEQMAAALAPHDDPLLG